MYNIRHKLSYLLHRITANNRHGLHSPFVYRLVDKVIYDFHAKNAYPKLKKIHSEAINDRRLTLLVKVLQLLYRLVADWHPASIIITHDDNTAATRCIRLAAEEAKFYLFNPQQQKLKADLIFMEAVPAKDLLLVFNQCLSHIKDNTMLIIPNIHHTMKGSRAWAAIKAHPKVTVTIDLFWLQLVYFKPGQAREDFKVRY